MKNRTTQIEQRIEKAVSTRKVTNEAIRALFETGEDCLTNAFAKKLGELTERRQLAKDGEAATSRKLRKHQRRFN